VTFDPFPGVILLWPRQVRELLHMTSNAEFMAFVREHPQFPRPLVMGKTPTGHPRHMWLKEDVIEFLRRMAGDPAWPPPQRRKADKRGPNTPP
jgi:hypothetical protein